MLVKDPVCGMEIDSDSVSAEQEYKGKTSYFCSQACKEKFKSKPEKFVSAEEDKR